MPLAITLPRHTLLGGGQSLSKSQSTGQNIGRSPFRLAIALGRALVACALPALATAQSGTQPAPQPAPAAMPSPTTPTVTPPAASAVRVTTSMGVFVIELQSDRAPLTVQNFLRYVNEGFYSNTLFHRVVGNFVVQGGGHDAATMKLKATHEYIVNESGNGLQNKRGTVGMARSGPAHSANSQFYINVADNAELDPLPTRWGYTVFGKVIEGMDVVDKIGVIATGAMGPFKSEAPLKAIVIEKVEALGAAPAATAAPSPIPSTAPPPPPGETPPPQ
jgi:cyclophilin family peptidyl-prolyl cis-trans isomerase